MKYSNHVHRAYRRALAQLSRREVYANRNERNIQTLQEEYNVWVQKQKMRKRASIV